MKIFFAPSMVRILISSFVLLNSAVVIASGFPNDTHSRLLSTGSDCGVVSIETAFMTAFGEQGARGRALVIQGSIRNLAYAKNVSVAYENGLEQPVRPDLNWVQNIASIFFRGQSGDNDLVTILDRSQTKMGTRTIKVKVWMQGELFTCSAKIETPDA